VLQVEQQHCALMRVVRRRVVAWKDGDDLRAERRRPIEQRGHQSERVAPVGEAHDLTQRQYRSSRGERAQRVCHRVDALGHREQRNDVGMPDEQRLRRVR